ncbi:hypothetical protein [Microbacterium sp. Se63.02b]|uniref:hypothetical protein n=1 Tax=Microbacterium sp. Se63.02b TaxID=2709304 RepID=UPI001604D82D|nr:hypothetical protein [Microbacterium sp. Se63.02b]
MWFVGVDSSSSGRDEGSAPHPVGASKGASSWMAGWSRMCSTVIGAVCTPTKSVVASSSSVSDSSSMTSSSASVRSRSAMSASSSSTVSA